MESRLSELWENLVSAVAVAFLWVRRAWLLTQGIAAFRMVRRAFNRENVMDTEAQVTHSEITEEVSPIKETLELAHAGGRLTSFAKVRLSDGVQVDDAIALGKRVLDDSDFRSELIAGVMGVQNVPAELKEHHSIDELAAIGAAFLAGFKEG